MSLSPVEATAREHGPWQIPGANVCNWGSSSVYCGEIKKRLCGCRRHSPLPHASWACEWRYRAVGVEAPLQALVPGAGVCGRREELRVPPGVGAAAVWVNTWDTDRDIKGSVHWKQMYRHVQSSKGDTERSQDTGCSKLCSKQSNTNILKYGFILIATDS